MKHTFYSSCVNWPGKVQTLQDMIENNTDITRNTFLKYIDRDELKNIEESLGYVQHPSQGLTMAGDWHVSYHKSTLKGFGTVYYFRHSAIEYVFVKRE